ncbi:hypothetical protein POPTR_002G011750v4 [Populus trichocarpa]|uniref:Uncharacterized protein n=1 Tax=Populus trichocarpa TaxID=3694 RepID=A0ACC0TBB5_POPTR|nr:hypothetical protein POPTR_002G011750v4 [Populus trichocarpa]
MPFLTHGMVGSASISCIWNIGQSAYPSPIPRKGTGWSKATEPYLVCPDARLILSSNPQEIKPPPKQFFRKTRTIQRKHQLYDYSKKRFRLIIS